MSLRRPSPVHVILVVVLLSTSGCSWLRNTMGVADEPDPAPVEAEATAAPADSTRIDEDVDFPEIDLPDVELPETEAAAPEATEPEPKDAVPAEVAPPVSEEIVPAPDDAMAEAESDSQRVVDPDPPLRVHIGDEERDELLAAIEADLDLARETSAQQPDLESLETEQRQRWETLAHYVQRTAAFLEADDLHSARDLALKARLLALELKPR